MTIEIKAPTFPESVADGTVATWHKQPGESVSRDELLVDIETDTVVLEVVAPADGSVEEIVKGEGETVLSDEVIGRFKEGSSDRDSGSEDSAESKSADNDKEADDSEAADTSKDSEAASTGQTEKQSAAERSADLDEARDAGLEGGGQYGPAVRKLLEEKGLDPANIQGTGKGGRIVKEDVLNHMKEQPSAPASKTETQPSEAAEETQSQAGRVEKRVPMTRLRATIAKRLVEAQQNAAMLTTYNEVDMEPVMSLRKRYRDDFEKAHNGTRLGFMSFFIKAATEALKRFPAVNASIDGDDMVYHSYQDVGVAVSTDRGLVVPILRDTDAMTLADMEKTIADFAKRARDGKLGIEDMKGGTFTITNGGIFGSLLSTPILNAPQTAILGMHKIQERAVVVDGEITVRPMMYLALSYDHRMIDGKEAVQFLVTIKELLEDPARMLLDI